MRVTNTKKLPAFSRLVIFSNFKVRRISKFYFGIFSFLPQALGEINKFGE